MTPESVLKIAIIGLPLPVLLGIDGWPLSAKQYLDWLAQQGVVTEKQAGRALRFAILLDSRRCREALLNQKT